MRVANKKARFSFSRKIAVVLLLSAQAFAQTYTGKATTEIDLKPLGVNVPEKGSVSATAIELLFLSDNFLALLEQNDRLGEPRNAHLTLYEIGDGSAQTKGTLNLGEEALPISPAGLPSARVLEWVDQSHFSIRDLAGRLNCSTDLRCQKEKVETKPVSSAHADGCEPGNRLGFIDSQRTLCLVPQNHANWSAIVIDSGGHRLYAVQQKWLPWDTSLVSSLQGERFGLEWSSNTSRQLLNPFACIDECPPAGRQQFVIFNVSDGQQLWAFEWDPRPYNLYVLPALSPTGKTAAFVKGNKLAIYSLPSQH